MNTDKYLILQLLNENKKLSEIAADLNVSQPTVSFHIKSLEEELGIKLVETNGKSLSLSQSGKSMIPYINEILSLDRVLHKKAKDLKLLQSNISIGSTLSPSTFFFPSILKEYILTHPNTQITIDVDSAKIIMEKIMSYQYDFGMISTISDLPEQLCSFELFQDSLVFLFPPKYESMFLQNKSYQLISQLNFIHHSENSSTRLAVEEILQELDLKPKSCITVNSIEVIRKLIKSEVGISILPMSLVQEDLVNHELSFHTIDSKNACKKVMLIYHKKRLLSSIASEMIELCKNHKV